MVFASREGFDNWITLDLRLMLVGDSPLLQRLHTLSAGSYNVSSMLVKDWVEDGGARQMLEFRPNVVVTFYEQHELPAVENLYLYGTVPTMVAMHAAAIGANLLHVSDPYVFPGRMPAAKYDNPYPSSVFGFARLLAERCVSSVHQNVKIVRVGWLYGQEYTDSNPMLAEETLTGERRILYVYDDMVGSPTYVGDAAIIISEMLMFMIPDSGISLRDRVIHVSPKQVTDWYTYLCDAYEKVEPTSFLRSRTYKGYDYHRNAGLVPSDGYVVPNGGLERFKRDLDNGTWDTESMWKATWNTGIMNADTQEGS